MRGWRVGGWVYLCDSLYNCTVNPRLDWAISTQQPQWPPHIYLLYNRPSHVLCCIQTQTHTLSLFDPTIPVQICICMYCISRRTFWTLVCIHVLYIPGTYMHNRAHWYISILMQYFISQLQQHCVVKGCDPSRSVCLGRRIPAKLVKVRIDYCSALSYLIFRFLPRLVSPLGPG